MGGARDELSSMSKIEGESFVKMRTNLGTRVLIMTSRTKLRAVLRIKTFKSNLGRVSCTHYFMSIHILVFSVQLIKITKLLRKTHCILSRCCRNPRCQVTASDAYRGFLDLGNAHSSGVLLELPTLLHFFLSLGMVIASL